MTALALAVVSLVVGVVLLQHTLPSHHYPVFTVLCALALIWGANALLLLLCWRIWRAWHHDA